MAVWIQIIGIRKLESIENEKKKIGDILNNTKFDFRFIQQNPDIEYTKNEWHLREINGLEFFELPLSEKSLKIYFDNPNFIQFSGSFEVFGLWSRFVAKEQSEFTNGIRKVFRKIAAEYGIAELIYFSEWFFEIGEIDTKEATFKDLINRINAYPHHKRNELSGLKSDEYYLEKTSADPSNGR